MPRGCLQFVIVVFPDHTHLLFLAWECLLNGSASPAISTSVLKALLVNLISKDTHLLFFMYIPFNSLFGLCDLLAVTNISCSSDWHNSVVIAAILKPCLVILLSIVFQHTLWPDNRKNTRLVSFDIKFTRQGFENACWHCNACQAIQHAFSKLILVNLISKDTHLVFYLSVYQVYSVFKLAILTYVEIFVSILENSVIGDVIQKVQRRHYFYLDKSTHPEIVNVL